MSCSLLLDNAVIAAAAGKAQEGRDRWLEGHVLFVEIPPRSTRARRWALARGIGDVDVAALAAMVRAERLSGG